jgi:superfamily II RNA helicase
MNPRPPEIPPARLVRALRGFDLLPAIVFLPTRRKCDESAAEAAGDRSRPTDPEKYAARRSIFDEFAIENPEVRIHKHRKLLVDAGVASHHAGHIPAWKLLVEKMMSAGLLQAIFATSTVAAGVDFPARTVVISNADTRGNDGWRPLRASELQQMTGRAGRRGKDKVGFVVLVPGQFQNPAKIAELLKAPPDVLESQFRSTYTTLLNLLDAFGSFDHVRDIASRSFAYGKAGAKNDREVWKPFENRARVLDHFGYIDFETETVLPDGKWLADVRVDRTLLVGEAVRRGTFDGLSVPLTAGLMAALAADSDRNYGDLEVSNGLMNVIENFEEVIFEVSNAEWKAGVQPFEEINLSAAATAERWAGGLEWQQLARRTQAEEGDLFRLLSRTGEALLQIANLRSSNPKAAHAARSSAEAILRDPLR